jgi:hypothetical protein
MIPGVRLVVLGKQGPERRVAQDHAVHAKRHRLRQYVRMLRREDNHESGRRPTSASW